MNSAKAVRAIFALVCIGCLAVGSAKTPKAAGHIATSADMEHVLAVVLKGLGGYHNALGMNDAASKDVKNATCIEQAKCTLDEALDGIQTSATQLREEVRERTADTNRLGGAFGPAAANALQPAVQALGKWGQVVRDLQSASPTVSRPLKKSAPKLRSSFDTTVAAFKAATDFLAFSGIPTTELEAGLQAAQTNP